MRQSTRIMIRRAGRIPRPQAVQVAVQVIAMTMITPTVRRTPSAMGKELEKQKEQGMGRGNGSRLRTGRRRRRQQTK
jgi:hypothetical protein